MSSQLPFAYVWFDGKRLSPDRRSGEQVAAKLAMSRHVKDPAGHGAPA